MNFHPQCFHLKIFPQIIEIVTTSHILQHSARHKQRSNVTFYLHIGVGFVATGFVLQVERVEPLKEGEVEAKAKGGVGLDSSSKISCIPDSACTRAIYNKFTVAHGHFSAQSSTAFLVTHQEIQVYDLATFHPYSVVCHWFKSLLLSEYYFPSENRITINYSIVFVRAYIAVTQYNLQSWGMW